MITRRAAIFRESPRNGKICEWERENWWKNVLVGCESKKKWPRCGAQSNENLPREWKVTKKWCLSHLRENPVNITSSWFIQKAKAIYCMWRARKVTSNKWQLRRVSVGKMGTSRRDQRWRWKFGGKVNNEKESFFWELIIACHEKTHKETPRKKPRNFPFVTHNGEGEYANSLLHKAFTRSHNLS